MHNLWLEEKYAGLLSVQLEKYKLKQQLEQHMEKAKHFS